MMTDAELAFATEFSDLVTRFGMAGTYGLARVRRWPELPRDHVYFETEGPERTLQIRVVPHHAVYGAVNSIWHVTIDENGEDLLVPVQPCLHARTRESGNCPFQLAGGMSIPEPHAAFIGKFVELVRRRGARQEFALARVHRHFDMTDDEVLLESAADDRSLCVSIVGRASVEDSDPVLWFVDTTRPQPELLPVQYVSPGTGIVTESEGVCG